MGDVTALFFDMGGVLLTNGWDRGSRQAAAKKFGLDWDDFEDRHELLMHGFEAGTVSLDEYLKRVVFYRERKFSKRDFVDFIYSQSQAMPETLSVLQKLAAQKKYLMATLNNESRELNEYRIRQFNLRGYFDVFLSSCYLGVRKPDAAIYKLALSITQRAGEECVFVDDRELNLECAKELRMHTIQFKDAAQLGRELKGFGVDLAG
ncbi:MAG TPA: HAD family phosphatase [Candidatus Acidoferrales bacterium]|nr:HAD family phosphatase [Candidatus Acidoferrales bacterium]